MANIALNTDPLDEMRLLPVSNSERLPAMLFLAALIHGILIIGITFNPEISNPFAGAISLDVTIVANPDQQIDRPDEAAYLAQASQQGGGNTVDQVRATAPLLSQMPVDNEGVEDGTAVNDAEAHERSADELLVTENRTDRSVQIDPRTDPEQQTEIAIAMEAGSETTLPLPQEDDASQLITDNEPRQLVISVDTRESVAAAYLDNWKQRVEAVGAAYLPTLGDYGETTGSPTLLVTIDVSGELQDAVVRKSSGSTILDLAALDILQRASPFDPFPKAMAAEHDVVIFDYKWLFGAQLDGESTD